MENKTEQVIAERNQLPFKNIMGYGTAAFGFNFIYILVASYVNIFFTNVLGISLAASGAIMLLARVWDGINDPIMGSIVDRTNTKHGKYRPYLIWGIIPLALTTVLIFYAPDLSMGLKTLYAGAVYILWGMAYTFANIPYMSMQSTLSYDSGERTKIITLKNIFVMAGAMVAMVAVPLLAVDEKGLNEIGFLKSGMMGAVLVIVCMLISFKSTEKFKYVDHANHEPATTKEKINAIIKNKPLILLSLTLFSISLLGALTGAQNYYLINVLNRPDLVMQFTLVSFIPIFLSMVCMPIAMKLEKRTIMTSGMILYTVASVAFYFVPSQNINGLLLTTALRGFGLGFANILIWSMITDSVDYALLKTGKQQGGVVFSTSTFMQKSSSGIGAALLNGLLILAAFNPELTQQSASTANHVKMILSFGPAIFSMSIVVLMLFYPLSKKRMIEIGEAVSR